MMFRNFILLVIVLSSGYGFADVKTTKINLGGPHLETLLLYGNDYLSDKEARKKGLKYTASKKFKKVMPCYNSYYIRNNPDKADCMHENNWLKEYIRPLETGISHNGMFFLSYPVKNGNVGVELSVVENYRDNYRTFDIEFEGQSTDEVPYLLKGEFYLPRSFHAIKVTDGVLNISVIPKRNTDEVHLMSLKIHEYH